MRMIALVVVVLAALLWGWFDAVRDRKKNPDPEHGGDLTMRWLKASVLGGILAGLGSWLVDLVPSLEVTQNPLFFELTSGAAFTVLLIFVPTMLAVAVTRILLNRKSSDDDIHHDGTAAAVPASGADTTDSGLGTEVLSLDQQHPNDQYGAQEYTGRDYDAGDPDADTTVFEPVPGAYREDTSDLDNNPDAQTSDLTGSVGDNSDFTDPRDVRGSN